ncbi:MAG: thermonuclease family protein [Thaumarchaeota archaeon]|nr:thermonuclease family protein [Nitrososphaerota archaeon]
MSTKRRRQDDTLQRLFTESLCTIGSNATVDEDDGQTEGSFGRMIGLVYCNGKNLNSELLVAGHAHIDPRFCSESEFAKEDWARKSGCQ